MDIMELLAKQKDRLEGIKPLEVEILLGDRVVTVVMPFLKPHDFHELATRFAPKSPQEMSFGFGLDETARNYPDIVIRDGEDEDNLLVVRDKAVHYRWPEVYELLNWDDKQSIRAGVWGVYVLDPTIWRKEAKAASEEASHE